MLQVNAQSGADFVEIVQNQHLFPPTYTAAGKQAEPQIWATAGHMGVAGPLFLHESTARALGIKPGAAPDLVAESLGRGALVAHRKKVKGLLMRPPPRAVAVHIAATVRCVPQLLRGAVVAAQAAAVRQCIHVRVSSCWCSDTSFSPTCCR